MVKSRDTTVDFLRGLAVLLMILIHVTFYYRNVTLAGLLWNYAQIAVPLFVFCSAYVFFIKAQDTQLSFSYLFKRAQRLLIPYYFYLAGLFIFTLLVQKKPLSMDSLLNKILLQGDRDLDWLIVLFIYFLVIMPVIALLEKKPILFWSFGIASLISSVILFFVKIPIHFRLLMWLPWSLILFTTFLFVKTKRKILFYTLIILLPFGVFVICRYLLQMQDRSLLLIDNKYPPNIYYLSYGLFLIYTFFLAHKFTFIAEAPIQPIFDFFSKYSYSIFFIHFLYLYLMLEFDYKKLQWWGAFLLITAVSAATQLLWNNRMKLISFQH